VNQRTVQFAAPLLIAGLLACGSGLRPVNPPSFIRPERVAFACVRTNKAGDPVPVPIEQCSPCKGHTGEHSLYAFVTQSARGELAAVNLKSRKVIDTQTTVPGYTFVPVGEAPSAIAVPTIDPRHTYVVIVGSSDLRVLDTERLLSTRGVTTATLAVIPLGRLLGGTTWQEAAPVDMVLSTDEQRLVIAAPGLHALIVIEVTDVERLLAGEITAAELPQTIVALSGLSAPTMLITATGSDRYSESCGVERPHDSQAVPPRTVSATSLPAMPVALTLDAEHDRVLVADSALPVIHAIDLTTLTEVTNAGRPLLVTGVPTLDVVMSPPVPVSHGDTVYEQYIYAIDAEHRGVLVINDRGVMQSVNSVGTPDRIDFGDRGAMSLEVIEPGYRECVANTALLGPRSLRGVFLAASMVDGSIQFADIYDVDATSRCTAVPTTGEAAACSAADPCAAIHRHRARIESPLTSPRPCVAPELRQVDGTVLPLTADEDSIAPNDQTTPGLVALATCEGVTTPALELAPPPEGMTEPSIECAVVKPADGRVPLVCVNADPWAMGAESWTATWEGATTPVGSGVLSADAKTFTTDTMDFCRAGVFGTAAATDTPFQIEIGVQTASLELRNQYELLFGKPDGVDCTKFAAKRADGTVQRLTFQIANAEYKNQTHALTLGDPEDVPDGFTKDNVIEAARYCVAGTRFTFLIRSFNRYTVVGDRSGYVHRVVRGAYGNCVVDPTADPLLEGQAIPGMRFENRSIAFQIGALGGDAEPMQDLRFVFPVSSALEFVSFEADLLSSFDTTWTIVSELRYSAIDTRLYAVDSSERGLLPIPLSPLPPGLSSTNAFR